MIDLTDIEVVEMIQKVDPRYAVHTDFQFVNQNPKKNIGVAYLLLY